MKTLNDSRNTQKTSWISLLIVLIFLAFVFYLDQTIKPTNKMYMLLTVLQKGSVYALAAVSMNLLNGYTGLFSLGHAGFMLIDVMGPAGTALGVLVAVILAGLMAAFFAYLIGLPVLRLKSDYLAIATLGFAEIIRAVFQWQKLGPITNGSNLLKSFARTSKFKLEIGDTKLVLSTFVPVLIATVSIIIVAAEAMGINLAKHKMISFTVSSFFAGVSGAMMAMVLSIAQASNFKSAMTYEILLMVVLGGIGSISGSVIGSFLFVAASEWWLRGLDSGTFLGITAPGIFRNGFRLVVFSIIIMIVVLFFRQGIMGEKEISDLFRDRKKKAKGAAK